MHEKSFSRAKRIESLIQTEIAKLIQFELTDKNLGFITVTGAKLSPDLLYAKIYITTHDEKNVKQVLKTLNDSSKFLRTKLAAQVYLKSIPKLQFFYDESIAYGSRISKLLNEIEKKD